jgi:hypothetical protein
MLGGVSTGTSAGLLPLLADLTADCTAASATDDDAAAAGPSSSDTFLLAASLCDCAATLLLPHFGAVWYAPGLQARQHKYVSCGSERCHLP